MRYCWVSDSCSNIIMYVEIDLPSPGRILRYMTAIGAIEQIASGQYGPNHLTQNLAEKVTEAGVQH